MLQLLLGPDDYSKKQHISALVKDKGADLAVYYEGDEMPGASRLTETDLFSKAKVFVFEGIMPEISKSTEKLASSPNYIIFSINKIDKRKKENKELLAYKDIVVKEFNLPHGLELNKWIEKRVGDLGGKIAKDAVNEFALRLGRDNAREVKAAGKVVSVEEVYNLWQAESEIKKLLAYASDRPLDQVRDRQIELEDVKALVSENMEVDVFEIINAIGEGRKPEALDLMQEFLKTDSAVDAKTAVIQLNALLSDQMRGLAITQDLIKNKVSDAEIIKHTGWKSGRLYIMKKISARLARPKVLETMKKLEALDEELKTSRTPPRVLLDMIVAQLF